LDSLAIPKINDYLIQSVDSKQITVCGNIISQWNSLGLILKKLQKLPLGILSVSQISPEYKYTSECPPIPRASFFSVPPAFKFKKESLYISPIEGYIQFEPSSSWPRGLPAITAIKSAFYVEIMKALKKQFKIQSHASSNHLDVYYEGFVFRFVIFYPKEVILAMPMEKELSEKEIEELLQSFYKKIQDSENAQNNNNNDDEINMQIDNPLPGIITSPLYRSYVLKPKFASLIHGFHHKHPSFGLTVRLVKKWLSAHMFDSHFHEEALELIVASIFTQSDNVVHRPASHLTAFIRVIYLLANWSWSLEPLIVDISGEMMNDDCILIKTSFESLSNSGNKQSLFIAYDNDLTQSVWTQEKPGIEVFERVVTYAKQTYTVIKSYLLPLDDYNFNNNNKWTKLLFTTSFDDYDLILHIDSEVCPRYEPPSAKSQDKARVLDLQYKFFENQNINEISVKTGNAGTNGYLIGFDPYKSLFETLQERFSTVADFYYNKFGKTIGVIWKPSSFSGVKESNIENIHFLHKIPIIVNGKATGLIPNILVIMQEIRSIGKNMIVNITVK